MTIVAERAARRPGPAVEDGLLRYGGRWTVISDVQLGVTKLLVSRFERVVPSAEVHAAYAAAGGSTRPASLRSLVHRLSRRFAEVDLEIRTIRSGGLMLSAAITDDDGRPPS